MKLSILLVTYNHQKYIDQCLQGICMQKANFDFEVIVADDCSSDDTTEIIQATLESKNISYRVLERKHNIGLEQNYKRGFEACSGEYVATLEGDDFWIDPNRLQKHVEFLRTHSDCSMSFDRLMVYQEDSMDFSIKEWTIANSHYFLTPRELASGNKLGNLSACVFRGDVLNKLKPGLFDMKIADWMLAMAFGQHGKIGMLKNPMTVYRKHSGGLWSKQNRLNQIEFILANIKEYNTYLNNNFEKEFNALSEKLGKEYIILKSKAKQNKLLPQKMHGLISSLARNLLPCFLFNWLKKKVYQ